MKNLLLLVAISALLFVGCNDPISEHGHPDMDSHPPAVSTPVKNPVAVVDGVTVVEITGNDRMKYNLETFSVPADSPVKLVFSNVGKMPKASMGHNVVILNLDSDVGVFAAAAASARSNGYIPEELADQIFVSTNLLGPGETDTIEFNAPSKLGEYVFLCTFPAHMFAGMRGVMVVE